MQPGKAPGVTYAVDSVLANLAGKAPVLIIAGTNAESTEAVGALILPAG